VAGGREAVGRDEVAAAVVVVVVLLADDGVREIAAPSGSARTAAAGERAAPRKPESDSPLAGSRFRRSTAAWKHEATASNISCTPASGEGRGHDGARGQVAEVRWR
jgi:hypothetical protein